MSFADTQEAPLRSYIETRARTLQNVVETAARNRDNLSATALEQQIDRESDQFVADVTTRLNSMRDEIRARRPTDEQQPDYAARMAQYQHFVASASTGVQRVTEWVNTIFERIIDVIKKIVKWIVDKAETVITVIEMIRDAFNEFMRFLLR